MISSGDTGGNSGAVEEILDGLTGLQRQRVRAVLDAENCEPQTVAAVRNLAGRVSGEITDTPDRPQRRRDRRLRMAWLGSRTAQR